MNFTPICLRVGKKRISFSALLSHRGWEQEEPNHASALKPDWLFSKKRSLADPMAVDPWADMATKFRAGPDCTGQASSHSHRETAAIRFSTFCNTFIFTDKHKC